MCDFKYKHINFEYCIKSLASSSSVLLLKGEGVNFLFIHAGNKTTVFAFTVNETGFSFISRREFESQCCIRKIVSNNKYILMLDTENQLYYLQITAGDECKAFHSSTRFDILTESNITWIKISMVVNCLTLTGVKEGIVFLYWDKALYIGYSSTASINTKVELTSKRLNDFKEQMCCLFTLIGEIAQAITFKIFKVSTKEVVLAVESSQITFCIFGSHDQILSQSYSANFYGEFVTDVVCFNQKKLIFIICRSGKILSMKFDSSGTFELSQMWLNQKVSSVFGYNKDYLIWSDLNQLYVSKVNSECRIDNIKVIYNLRGIKLLTSIDSNILAVSVCGCIYEFNIDEISDKRVTELPCNALNKIYDLGKITEELKKDVKDKEQMIEALMILKDPTILNGIVVSLKKDLIIIENKTKYTFLKKYWSIQIECVQFKRKVVEIKELECDLQHDDNIAFLWNNYKLFRIALKFTSVEYTSLVVLKVETKGNVCAVGNELCDLNQFLKDNYS